MSHLDQYRRGGGGEVLGDAQRVPGVQGAVNKDDLANIHSQAPVLRHSEGRAPGHQLRPKLWPEHVRTHLCEETERKGVSKRVTWDLQLWKIQKYMYKHKPC